MLNNGIMEEIRSLLTQGEAASDVIARGFKPSTVYKAQRQLQRRDAKTEQPPPPSMAQVLVTNIDPQMWSDLKAENTQLKQQLEEKTEEIHSLQEELTQALNGVAELEVEAGFAQSLRKRVAILEPQVEAAGKWERKYQELEHHFGHNSATMDQKVQEWQGKFVEEQKVRQQVQTQIEQYAVEVKELKEENQQLGQRLEALPNQIIQEAAKVVKPPFEELAALRECWVGHPCKFCRKPTSGITSRKVAAEILHKYG